MTGLAVWLAVVGACDLIRAGRDTTSVRRRAAIAGVGVSLLLLAIVSLQPEGLHLAVGAGWVVAFLLWLLGSAGALSQDGLRVAGRVVAFAGLAAGVVLGLAVDDGVTLVTAAPGALGGVPLERVLLVVAVVLLQLSTANIVVRLVLDAVGVPAADNEKQLKGGRVLGPMERVFLVALGAAGHVTAAAIVVAAKGLLRFPELQRGERAAGPSDVTEYFLIGSFASWLVALGGVGLLALQSTVLG